LLVAEERFPVMKRTLRVWSGAALAIVVPARLLTVPVSGGLERYLGWINAETSLTIV